MEVTIGDRGLATEVVEEEPSLLLTRGWRLWGRIFKSIRQRKLLPFSVSPGPSKVGVGGGPFILISSPVPFGLLALGLFGFAIGSRVHD